MKLRKAIVTRGRNAGKIFMVEATIEGMEGGRSTDLPSLAARGNWAAKNAIDIDKYTHKDGPFYYGKIQQGPAWFGYIVAERDFRFADG